MRVKVVDASALAALLFNEPESGAVASELEAGRLVAPALLRFELANVCLQKSRRHPDLCGALKAAFSARDRLRIEEVAIDHGEVVELAGATGLTCYDASYLWLAHRLGAELVTLDRQLARASASPRLKSGP